MESFRLVPVNVESVRNYVHLREGGRQARCVCGRTSFRAVGKRLQCFLIGLILCCNECPVFSPSRPRWPAAPDFLAGT